MKTAGTQGAQTTTGGTVQGGSTGSTGSGEGAATSLLSGTSSEGTDTQQTGNQTSTSSTTTTGQGATGEQTQQGQQTSQTAPAEIDLKLPDGFAKDDPLIGDFTKTAKDLGLKSESAQKLFDLYAGAKAAEAKALNESLSAQTKQWVDSIKADKEFGGENFKASLVFANKAIDRFGSPELRQALTASGLGNHPEVVKIGRAHV